MATLHFDFYWTVGRKPAHDGVEQWIEPHRLALWTDAQYRDAFAAAGLSVEHDADGLIGRGLYLGHRSRD